MLGVENPPGEVLTSLVPLQVPGVSGAAGMAVREKHVCVASGQDQVVCWGNNEAGQLGMEAADPHVSTPVVVVGVSGAERTAVGRAHSCVLTASGLVMCWGQNWDGQIGNGMQPADPDAPVPVSGVTDAVFLAWGLKHTCALLEDATVRCWGRNAFGQLGDGTDVGSDVPVAVGGLSGAVSVGAGYDHSCAVLDDGTARCWGAAGEGQIGNGGADTTYCADGLCNMTPVVVSGLSGVVQIAGGQNHTCAVVNHSAVWCWGKNNRGQLGDGTHMNRDVPVQVTGL